MLGISVYCTLDEQWRHQLLYILGELKFWVGYGCEGYNRALQFGKKVRIYSIENMPILPQGFPWWKIGNGNSW